MNNRDKIKLLLSENRMTQREAVELIEDVTHRPCSLRAFHSWINYPDKPSSRSCPDWVINVLEKSLLEKGNKS